MMGVSFKQGSDIALIIGTFKIIDIENSGNLVINANGVYIRISIECTIDEAQLIYSMRDNFIGKYIKIYYEGNLSNLETVMFCPVKLNQFQGLKKTPSTLPSSSSQAVVIDSIEVINARKSIVENKTYVNIGARFEDIESALTSYNSLVSSINSSLSLINSSMSTISSDLLTHLSQNHQTEDVTLFSDTLYTSDAETVLPNDVYDDSLFKEIELQGNTTQAGSAIVSNFTNLVTDSSVWLASGVGTYAKVGNSHTVTGNGSSATPRMVTTFSGLACQTGRRLFVRFKAKVDRDANDLTVYIFGSTSNDWTAPVGSCFQAFPLADTWYTKSGIVELTSGQTGDVSLRIVFPYGSTALANGAVLTVEDIAVEDLGLNSENSLYEKTADDLEQDYRYGGSSSDGAYFRDTKPLKLNVYKGNDKITEASCPVTLRRLSDTVYDTFNFNTGIHTQRIKEITNQAQNTSIDFSDMKDNGLYWAASSGGEYVDGVKGESLSFSSGTVTILYELIEPVVQHFAPQYLMCGSGYRVVQEAIKEG